EPVALVTIHGHNTSRPDRLRYWYIMKALRHLYRSLKRIGAWKEVAVVRHCISGKLDFVLTRIRIEEDRYFERLKTGLKALYHFPVTCLTLNNLKSIYVFLVRK